MGTFAGRGKGSRVLAGTCVDGWIGLKCVCDESQIKPIPSQSTACVRDDPEPYRKRPHTRRAGRRGQQRAGARVARPDGAECRLDVHGWVKYSFVIVMCVMRLILSLDRWWRSLPISSHPSSPIPSVVLQYCTTNKQGCSPPPTSSSKRSCCPSGR